MSIRQTFAEFHEWMVALPADFQFLMALPFLVAMVGVISDRGRPSQGEQRRERHKPLRQHRRPLSPAPL